MKKILPVALILIASLVFFSGCTSDSTKITPETQSTAVIYTETPVPTEEQYVVTKPLLVIGEDIYSTKISIDAKESGSNSLIVTVKFDSTNQMGKTGAGMDLMTTIFAYNYDDVPASFNPQTKEEIIAAGIPYKTVLTTLYPNNVKSSGADLPGDSVQGSLSINKAYNYGAIIVKEGERN
ncbi:MAG: hypothetical protein JXQ82_04630 [Methanomicrobiaceae archaeon]|nr:hypothetical protein [Methanomicrobiaceae archaeon]